MNVARFIALEQPIQVMDVGASAINEVPVYKPPLDLGAAHLNAFEGDQRQIEGIKAAYGDHATIFEDFLFDGSEQTLHLASGPSGMTSLLKPRTAALQFFNGFEIFGRVEKTQRVQTKRMDDVEGLPLIDFLKMDIQGGELTVLKHGTDKLTDCVAVQLEVSFVALYENQPSFGEVDVWMRGQGYVPHRFMEVKRWSIAPTVFQNNFRIPGNQLMEADIVYIRDPLRLGLLSIPQLKKLAVLAHHCFKSYDLCVHVLLHLERIMALPQGVHRRYLAGEQTAA